MASMNWKKVHVIGIGGVGMSAVARLLRESGAEVTGSDEGVYPPISTFLENEGIGWQPYSASNIPADADMIMIGKNAKLVPETNEEVRAAYESGKLILSFPEVLGALSQNKDTVVVAGSYGKSTTAAMLSHCLVHAGKAPSFFIGAIPFTPGTNAQIGAGDLFVMEGDEYPSSNTDPRSKFLHLHPTHLLLTPLAHDHINVFPTPDSYVNPFKELVTLVTPGGTITACVEGELSSGVIAFADRELTTYGFEHGDWQAASVIWGETTLFTITHKGSPVCEVATTLLGEHNIQNIVGAAAFLVGNRFLTAPEFVAAMANFQGIKRRLDRLTKSSSVPCFEGFGSSDAKAKSAISAIKLHFPEKRLVVVFEPHTFSWRNRATMHWYDTTFKDVATMLVYHPAEQGAATHEQATHEDIMARLASAQVSAAPASTPEDVMSWLNEEVRKDDVVLILTSGPMDGLVETIPSWLDSHFSQ